MEKLPALKEVAKEIRAIADPELDKLKALVGPGWAKALRGNTCSGLPVNDFACSFGDEVLMWYGEFMPTIQVTFTPENIADSCEKTLPPGERRLAGSTATRISQGHCYIPLLSWDLRQLNLREC